MSRRTARVFTADDGAYGNEVAVVLVHEMPSAEERQRLATEATEPATVFVAEDGVEWLFAPAAWSPNARHRRVESPAEVEDLTGAPADEPVQVWAWLDEAAGVVRARMFAPSEGKPEDEACGSASMVLAGRLGRELRVVHGRGSVIQVRPELDGIRLGGRCVVTQLAGAAGLSAVPAS